MTANTAFHIAVLSGDGIGPEVMTPTLEILRLIEATTPSLKFRFTESAAGAGHYKDTGKSLPESTVKLCEGSGRSCSVPAACKRTLSDCRNHAGRIAVHFDLYRRRAPPGSFRAFRVRSSTAHQRGIDFVLNRESTEGLFASMGKGVVTQDEARETLVITRKTSQRLFDFSLRLAERRKKRGKPGLLTCVDKANAFKAYAYFRSIFDERAKAFPNVKTNHVYVDACAALMVRKPWDFDVMVMENIFGDILSDLAAGLIGGLGIAPSADIGDKHAVFQPCHGTAPDIMGEGKANPTAMILSAAMMLDWLADRHDHPPAADAALRIERAVDKARRRHRTMEYGGGDSTAAIAKDRAWHRSTDRRQQCDGATSIGSLMVLKHLTAPGRKIQPCRSIPSERRGKGRDPAIRPQGITKALQNRRSRQETVLAARAGQWPQPGNSMYRAPATFSICLLSAGGVA
jgi:3-isopropylmalate dehydrogenase